MHLSSQFRAFIIDMDGVLWHGSQALPGLRAFFDTLRAKDIRFILATNNASLTPQQYVQKLAHFGVTVSLGEILTSGMATAYYLKQHYEPIKTRVFVIGEGGATEPLSELGFVLTSLDEIKTASGQGADLVVCGKDETLTWAKLATATLNIRAGAVFFATNGDMTLPTERGVIHGNGAILAALEAATGVAPIVIGKPEPIIYQQALQILDVSASETLAIGDRLETDILGAIRAGISSMMVLSGISSLADLKVSSYQPTWTMPDIAAITQLLNEN